MGGNVVVQCKYLGSLLSDTFQQECILNLERSWSDLFRRGAGILHATRKYWFKRVTKEKFTDLVHAPPELKANPELVREAVNGDGRCLGYASKDLKADKAMVMLAVQQNGLALD